MPIATRDTVPQSDPPLSPRETLPTMYDLPSEFPEEPGLPDEFHDLQPQLLSRTLSLVDYRREDWFAGSDLNVYFDVKHPLWHKCPDWFLAVGVPFMYDGTELRWSYVIWQEGRSPHVVIEFLSPGTEASDLGRFYQVAPDTAAANGQEPGPATPPDKFTVYEKYLRVPHYLVYDRRTERLRYFLLVGGEYQEQPVQSQPPWVWLADLQIGLALWDGVFESIPGQWLRWCNAAGQWLLTETEREREARAQAEQRADALAQRLRELGVDPDEIGDH